MPIVLAPLIAALIRGIQIMMAIKAAVWVIKILGVLGLAFATNELLMEPLFNHVATAWANLPPSAVTWAKALGLTEVASIMVTAYTVLSGKRVFMTAVTPP